MWLIFGMIPFLTFSSCGDLEPEMQDTRSVFLKMNFNQRSSSRSSQISQAELSSQKTHLILALPAWENLNSSYRNYYSSFAHELMNPSNNRVSLEIPLNTQMKIFAFLFREDYTMQQLLSGVREVGYYGESQPFSIGTNTNNLKLGITLQSTGTTTGNDGGNDNGSQGGIDSTAPTVTFSPANGTASIGVSGSITITFNEAVRNIDNTELTNNNIDSLITLKLNNANGNNISFNATINTDKTVITINPTSSLPNSQVVYVAIGATVEDSAGNAIVAANVSFTTMPLQSTMATQPPLENPSSAYHASSNKYVVSTLGHLSYVAQNSNFWTYNYIQKADIDATVTKYWDDADDTGTGVTGDKYNDDNDRTSTGNNEGFLPIGNSITKFTGEYDGGGYYISNLTIKRTSTQKVGLFGDTSSATIRNLSVINDNITGSSWVGSLVGIARSTTIDNCSASGSVASNDLTGGLVGYVYCGSSCTNSIIRNSYSTATVIDGQSGRTGGLVGFIHNSTILNSYSIGSVVSSQSSRGGLVGTRSGASTITDSFYDSDTSGQSDTGKGIGKTTSQMKTLATFTDTASASLTGSWDFYSIWEIDSSGTINDGYPYLKSYP